jgi:hypothetical protein
MNKNVLSGKVTRLHGEVFVIGCFEDVRPLKGAAGEVDWLFAGLLSHLFVQKKMTGAKGETALLATQGKIPIQKVLLVGLGEKGKYGLPAFEGMVEMVIRRLKQMDSREPILELLGVEECGLPAPKALAFLVKALNGNKEQRELSFYVRSDERARELKQRLRFSPGDLAVG